MKTLMTAILGAALALGACSKDKGKDGGDKGNKPTADAAATATNTPPPTPDAAPADSDEAIPTSEDFEEEAATAVTEDNLETELEQIEEELGE